MPLNMKVFICSDKNLIDHNDTYLPAGKYYFNIENFTEKNTIIGDLVFDNKKKSKYEFRFFSFLTMMAKGQSYLSRRAKIKNDNMPNYPSPVKLKTPKFLKKKKKISVYEVKNTCSICLDDESIGLFEQKTLSCGHKFHESCVNDWLTYGSSCPNCRKEIKK